MCPPVIGHTSPVSTCHWSSFSCDALPLVIILLWSPVIGHTSPVSTVQLSLGIFLLCPPVIGYRKISQDLLVISSLLNVFLLLSKATSCVRFHAQKPFMSLKRFPESKPKFCIWTTKHFDTVEVWSSELIKISLICLKYYIVFCSLSVHRFESACSKTDPQEFVLFQSFFPFLPELVVGKFLFYKTNFIINPFTHLVLLSLLLSVNIGMKRVGVEEVQVFISMKFLTNFIFNLFWTLWKIRVVRIRLFSFNPVRFFIDVDPFSIPFSP